MDTLIRVMAGEGNVKLTAVTTKELTERARKIHGCTAVVTAALGRTLAATSMIGNAMKEEKASVTVRINGGGDAGSIIAVSDSEGNVRGYVQNPRAWLEPRPNGKLDVGGIVGTQGAITVMRDFGYGEPYIGSTGLISGEIAEDFTRYFAESEQTPTAVALGVLVSKADGSVLTAGGYIVQLLPGADPSYAEVLEKNIAKAGSVTSILMANGTPDALAEAVLEGLEPEILQRQEITYKCYCDRKRVLGAVASLGEEELLDMEREGKTVEVRCQFCDQIYRFEPSELRAETEKE